MAMQKYRNLGGNSGVDSYEIGDGSITVRFTDGWAYLYTDAVTGAGDVRQMQALAERGAGLNSYISRVVKKRWADKWRG